jgi:hypothetical protein
VYVPFVVPFVRFLKKKIKAKNMRTSDSWYL